MTIQNDAHSLYYARLSTYMASLLWALIVLFRADAMVGLPYAQLVDPKFEDVWGAVIGFISITMIYRVMTYRASQFGTILHTILLAFWLYITISLYISDVIFPTAGASVPVIAGLALYGLIGDAHGRFRFANFG